ncbi:MAG TPA: insulinase family protein [Pyrinomonadaceae bacterium]|nr:insulinase family protein [Pyrinomonadaceae bacterium]
MKKFFFSSFLILSILTASSLAQPAKGKQTAPTTAPKAEQTKQPVWQIPFVNKNLANGLEVIVLRDPSVPIATIEVAVRNGSFTEPPVLNGLSHLYEHMFFKTNRAIAVYRCEIFQFRNRSLFNRFGCDAQMGFKKELGDVSYLNEVDNIGYLRNGTTQEEDVNYFFNTTSQNVPTMMRLMRDALLFPSFEEEEFKQEIQVVLGELDRQQSEPGYYLDRTLMDKLFYKHPSRKSPGGTRETVSSATTDQMRLIQSRYYVPNNSALIVTGDVEPEQIFKLAQELFGGWKRGEDPFKKFPIVEHPPLQKSEGVIVNKDVENVIVQIGWHGPSIGKDDAGTYAADVFSFIMEQPDSRLNRALIDSGLAAAVSVHYYTQRNVGPIRITLVTSPEKAKEALKVLYGEIAQFNDPKYFTDEELENAKTLLEAEDLFRREKLSEYTHSLGFWWSSTGIDYFRGYHKNLRAVSREDIKRYISNYIQGKPHVSVALVSSEAQQQAKLTEQDLIGAK